MKKIIVLLIFIITSCDSNKIKSLEVHYYKPGIYTPMSNFCSSNLFVNLEDVRYKKIEDVTFLEEFENYINSFELSEVGSVNSRVFTLINYKSGNIDTLCVGEYRGIRLNGKVVISNGGFHKLLLDKIDFYNKLKP